MVTHINFVENCNLFLRVLKKHKKGNVLLLRFATHAHRMKEIEMLRKIMELLVHELTIFRVTMLRYGVCPSALQGTSWPRGHMTSPSDCGKRPRRS